MGFLTKKEWSLVAMGVVGLVSAFFVTKNLFVVAAVNFCVAFTFEASMDLLFDYSPDLKTKRCIAKTDVNFLFPLGWNLIFGTVALSANNSWFGTTGAIWQYVLAALVIGNIMERVFFHFGYWTYNFDGTFLGMKVLKPKLTIKGIPVQVILGYSVVGVMVWFLMAKVIA